MRTLLAALGSLGLVIACGAEGRLTASTPPTSPPM